MATAPIEQLLAEERYARERYDLYKAREIGRASCRERVYGTV